MFNGFLPRSLNLRDSGADCVARTPNHRGTRIGFCRARCGNDGCNQREQQRERAAKHVGKNHCAKGIAEKGRRSGRRGGKDHRHKQVSCQHGLFPFNHRMHVRVLEVSPVVVAKLGQRLEETAAVISTRVHRRADCVGREHGASTRLPMPWWLNKSRSRLPFALAWQHGVAGTGNGEAS